MCRHGPSQTRSGFYSDVKTWQEQSSKKSRFFGSASSANPPLPTPNEKGGSPLAVGVRAGMQTDVVIVGGGMAGCAVAAHLSPRCRVTVMESSSAVASEGAAQSAGMIRRLDMEPPRTRPANILVSGRL